MSAWLTLVGIGEDGYAGLSKAARQALLQAEQIWGAPRQLQLLPPHLKAERCPWPSPFSLEPVLIRRDQPLCVLASGDPMWFGVGASLARQLEPHEFQVFSAPSSASLAAARLGWPLQEVELMSLVGRPLHSLSLHLQEGARLLVLSADGSTPMAVAQLLCERGFGLSVLKVFEHLGGPQERCIEAMAERWSIPEVAALNLIAIECHAAPDTEPLSLSSGLPDSAFQHDGQLTKQDVRAITLARLAPKPRELLWDVGAGCGSIGIEWLRAHPSCSAIAIECDTQRAERIRHNSAVLGVPQLQLVVGHAPEALADLPPPDAIFIGGGGTVEGVMEHCWSALKPGGRLLANAVTLESEALLLDWQRRLGGSLLRIQLAQAKPLGNFSTWRAALPITLLVLHKPAPQSGLGNDA